MKKTSNDTTVTDIDIPFLRLVGIILKFMLASIPAVIVFYIIIGLLTLLVASFFGGSAVVLKALTHH